MTYEIYDKPGCAKCRMTERKFKVKGIPYTRKTLLTGDNKEYTDKKLAQFKEQGFSSFPIVKVYNEDGSLVDSWCDLRMDKLNEYLG